MLVQCKEAFSPGCLYAYTSVNHQKQKQNLAQCLLKKNQDTSVCLMLVASGWLTMTNILKCGYSLGTKPLPSLNRVGRITLILLLPLGKLSCWAQLESELLYWARHWEDGATAWNVFVVRQGLLYTSILGLHIFSLVYLSHSFLHGTCVVLKRQQSHDSLLSLAGQITKQILFESFCSEMVLRLSSNTVAAKRVGISSSQLVWGLQINHSN